MTCCFAASARFSRPTSIVPIRSIGRYDVLMRGGPVCDGVFSVRTGFGFSIYRNQVRVPTVARRAIDWSLIGGNATLAMSEVFHVV